MEMSAIKLILWNQGKGERDEGQADSFQQTHDPACPPLLAQINPRFIFNAPISNYSASPSSAVSIHLCIRSLVFPPPPHLPLSLRPPLTLSPSLSLSCSEMKQELAEECSRCSILSKQHRFNEHCCIRCCAPFTFLLNPKRLCLDCQYNVCKTCCTYSKREKAWLCSACQKGRLVF